MEPDRDAPTADRDRVVEVDFDAETVVDLDRYARERGLTRPAAARELFEEWLGQSDATD
jgi:hypothetical protein